MYSGVVHVTLGSCEICVSIKHVIKSSCPMSMAFDHLTCRLLKLSGWSTPGLHPTHWRKRFGAMPVLKSLNQLNTNNTGMLFQKSAHILIPWCELAISIGSLARNHSGLLMEMEARGLIRDVWSSFKVFSTPDWIALSSIHIIHRLALQFNFYI